MRKVRWREANNTNDRGLKFCSDEDGEMKPETRILEIPPILVEFQILNFSKN